MNISVLCFIFISNKQVPSFLPSFLYADGIVVCGTRSEVVEKKLEEWRRAMAERGLKINRKKTVYPRFN